jgi:hypothetical protein
MNAEPGGTADVRASYPASRTRGSGGDGTRGAGAKSSSLTPFQLGAAGALASALLLASRGGSRSTRPITAAATSWRRSFPTPTAAVCSRSSMAAPAVALERYMRSISVADRERSRSSDRSLRRLPASGQGDPPERHGVCDSFHLVRGVNTALDTSCGSANAWRGVSVARAPLGWRIGLDARAARAGRRHRHSFRAEGAARLRRASRTASRSLGMLSKRRIWDRGRPRGYSRH